MKSAGTLLVVVALSVGTWLVFYLMDLPLDLPGTGVVCGFWLALALLGKWLWSRRAAAKKVGGSS